MKKINISKTVEINSLAQLRAKQGLPVHNLAAGEPVMDIFKPVKVAALSAIKGNKALYPPVAGIPELRTKTSEWLNKTCGTHFKSENILITNGGKLGLYLTLQALLKTGDEVIIPAPFWVSYPDIVRLFGGKAKIIKTTLKEEWKITPSKLKEAINSKTKILILNNACNPTGILYSKEELRAILQIAEEKKLTVISDEVYSGLVFDKNIFVSCGAFPEFSKRVIIIQSCSKNFAMTGWRIGFVCADSKLIQTLTILLSQSTSGATTISQWAALGAMQNADKIIKKVRQEMQSRRDLLLQLFHQKLGIKLDKPQSALYLFVSLKDLGVSNKNSIVFCKKVLEKTGVILVPGSAFGQEGFVRFSFGAKPEVIKRAVNALAGLLG